MSNVRNLRAGLQRRALLVVAVAIVHCTLAANFSQAVAQDTAATVRLTVDYGDGVQKFFAALPWKEKLTVFDVLQAAEKHPHGIKLTFIGRGETIFITAIDGMVNEGANRPNWRYTVNDQPARSSAGVMELKAGDSVVWRFAK
jgi:hypothetical protein